MNIMNSAIATPTAASDKPYPGLFELSLTAGAVKEATVGISSGDLWKVSLDDFVILDEFNARDRNDELTARIRGIADSIKANGYLPSKAISVYVAKVDGKSVLVVYDGHCRLAAAKLARSEGADIQSLPAVTAPKGTSMEDLTVGLVTTNSGDKLKPNEVASVCKRLINFGMESPEIAKRLGFTRIYVESLLDLAAAPREIRAMVSAGVVSATLAIATVKKHGAIAKEVLQAAEQTVKAAGKVKVTNKTVSSAPKAGQKPAHDEQAEKDDKRPSQIATQLESGIKWLSRYADAGHASAATLTALIGFLSHLTGTPSPEIRMALAKPAK
jgi:ParB family transcriptional regulator, chromosome partitioning protein